MGEIKLSNKTYDVLKEVITIWLPAIGAFYYKLADIWGMPYGEQVVATISAFVACVGVILHISTVNYNKAQAEADCPQTVFNADGIDMFDFEEVDDYENENETACE